MRSPLVASLTAVSVGLLAAPAAAAPPWSPPQTVLSDDAAALQGLTVGGDATALTVSSTADRRGRLTAGLPGSSSRVTGPFVDLAGPPVTYAQTRAVFLRPRPADESGFCVDVGLSFGRTAGERGPRRDLGSTACSSPRGDVPVALAASPRGDVAVAWAEGSRVGERTRIRLAVRRPGGQLSRATVVRGAGSSNAPALAFNARGDLLLAYEHGEDALGRERTIEVRVRPAGGRTGPVREVGPAGDRTTLSVGMAGDGRALVGWAATETSEAGELGTEVLVAGALLDGAFEDPQRLETASGGGRVRVAADAEAQDAVIAWDAFTGQPDQPVVRVADIRSGRAGEAQQLVARAQLGDAAIEDRRAIVTWTVLGPNDSLRLFGAPVSGVRVEASVRPAGGARFGAPEAVSADGRVREPAIAVGPQGTPLVAWLSPGRDGIGAPGALRLSRREG
ncbi:MAG: hypothetical protein MSC31_11050 [Solirubrobacteraceae bacterium MAG38_C4-C5]|nr:hypothetical protein [Candidatus Siliceabacter maunaloa]